jgi:hypothetical protein
MMRLSALASLLALGAVGAALTVFALTASAGEPEPPSCVPEGAPCEVPTDGDVECDSEGNCSVEGTVPVCEGTICETEPFPCDPDAEVCAFEGECDPEAEECDVPVDSGDGEGCDPTTGECDDLVPPCPPEAEVCILEFGVPSGFEGIGAPGLTNPLSEISESFPVGRPTFAEAEQSAPREAPAAGADDSSAGPAVDTGDSGTAEDMGASALQVAMVGMLAALSLGSAAFAYRRMRR